MGNYIYLSISENQLLSVKICERTVRSVNALLNVLFRLFNVLFYACCTFFGVGMCSKTHFLRC